jgi:hypothetical protein
MRDQKSNTFLKQPSNPLWLEEEDNRIDWSRKSRKKRHEPDEPLEDGLLETSDELADELYEVVPRSNKRKSDKRDNRRDKRRQLVLDEASGRVRVKRRRKTNRNLFDAWLDEYE